MLRAYKCKGGSIVYLYPSTRIDLFVFLSPIIGRASIVINALIGAVRAALMQGNREARILPREYFEKRNNNAILSRVVNVSKPRYLGAR